MDEYNIRSEELGKYLMTGVSLFISGEYQKAIVYCDKQLQNDPNDCWAFYYKAKSFYKLNSYDDAFNNFTQASLLNPKDWNARIGLSICLIKKGKINKVGEIEFPDDIDMLDQDIYQEFLTIVKQL